MGARAQKAIQETGCARFSASSFMLNAPANTASVSSVDVSISGSA